MVEISWEIRTAYDFFISLSMLHVPGQYELRRSWAAGVRSRLPIKERELLQQVQQGVWLPIEWIFRQPGMLSAADVLNALANLPPQERLLALMMSTAEEEPIKAHLLAVAERGSWGEADLEAVKAAVSEGEKRPLKRKIFTRYLDAWAVAISAAPGYLDALASYYDTFFKEEERRIRPILQRAVDEAQEAAKTLSLSALLEGLSQGIHYELPANIEKLVLSPSFWSTPLIIDLHVDITHLFIFGARPTDMSLVPGAAVPDDLQKTLKALADPTRLRIMHYLAQRPYSPTELAKELRLRPPTVTHHLQVLRLARLVSFHFSDGRSGQYTVREAGITGVIEMLQAFMGGGAKG